MDQPAAAAKVESKVETFPKSGREESKDQAIRSDISNTRLSNILFTRLVAKRRQFKRVDFKYSIFDACYLRDSSFDTCDFTGCRFISCNMHGATFSGCNFEYATFERTVIDESILDVGCPGRENLKMRFARSLRMNYQQIGDAQAANKAVRIELEAHGTYLYKAWRSNESYHRKKYAGFDRFRMFLRWAAFRSLDFVWGNGESTVKLLRFVGIIFLFIAITDQLLAGQSTNPISIGEALVRAPQLFFGVLTPEQLGPSLLAFPSLLALVVFLRLAMFGFFMSIIIKRFNRR
jgi:hypothetical protein